MSAPALAVLVMGVCGCGKSTVGQQLAREIGAAFIEGDTFHSAANIAKMAAGTPLTDEDREGWLQILAVQLTQARAERRSVVLACSALKHRYRDTLRSGAPALRIVHLTGLHTLLAERMAARSGHYMPPTLLESQLATLEAPDPDEQAITVDIAASTEQQVRTALAQLHSATGPTP